MERANGGIGETLRAFANGRKDDWDRQLPLTVLAINAASTLGDGLMHFFMDWGAHSPPPRPRLSGGYSPAITSGGRDSPRERVARAVRVVVDTPDKVFQVLLWTRRQERL